MEMTQASQREYSFDKETKGTYRFKEIHPDSEPDNIGLIYIRKHVFKEGKPTVIKVTVDIPVVT